MSNGRLIVACDFGTTTFRALVTEVFPNGEMEIIGCASRPALGFQDGDFVDMGSGSKCIAETMKDLEEDSSIYVTGFTYNTSGSHLRSVMATAQVTVGPGPRPIQEADVEAARTQARGMTIPFDHKILTVTPVEFAVDRVKNIIDPLGRVGSQLEMKAHLITGSRSVLDNIENAIDGASCRPLGEEVDILAVGMALLSDADKKAGVFLIDIGGHATNWAVYRKGAVVATGMVPLGGHHMTMDLAHGLRISPQEAEDVKRKRGVVLKSLVGEVSIEALFNEESPEETPGMVAAILEPRLEEILMMVKDDYGNYQDLASLGSGLVITGGGSRCQGTRRHCEEIFDLQGVKSYLPARLRGAEKLADDQWATVIGLSLWAGKDAMLAEANGEQGMGEGFWGKVTGIFKRKRNRQEELAAKG